jgi:hypothetical protein
LAEFKSIRERAELRLQLSTYRVSGRRIRALRGRQLDHNSECSIVTIFEQGSSKQAPQSGGDSAPFEKARTPARVESRFGDRSPRDCREASRTPWRFPSSRPGFSRILDN